MNKTYTNQKPKLNDTPKTHIQQKRQRGMINPPTKRLKLIPISVLFTHETGQRPQAHDS